MIWDQLDKGSDTTEARFTTIVRHATTKPTILEAHFLRDFTKCYYCYPELNIQSYNEGGVPGSHFSLSLRYRLID